MIDANLDGVKSDRAADALDAVGVPFFFATSYNNLASKDSYRGRHVLKKPSLRALRRRLKRRSATGQHQPPTTPDAKGTVVSLNVVYEPALVTGHAGEVGPAVMPARPGD